MTYFMDVPLSYDPTRTESVFKLSSFTTDLACELGGTVCEPLDCVREYESIRGFHLDGVHYGLSRGYGSVVWRVTIQTYAADRVARKAAENLPKLNWPSMTCDVNRSIKAIATEVRRKLIPHVAVPMERIRAEMARISACKAGIDSAVANMQRIFPNFELLRNQYSREIATACIGGFNVTIQSDGSIYIPHGFTVPEHKLHILADLLRSENPQPKPARTLGQIFASDAE